MADIVASITLDDSGYQQAAKRVVDANQRIVETKRQIVPATGAAAAFDRLRQKLVPAYDAQKKLEAA